MLLDTHVLLWILDGSEQIGRDARWTLEHADTVEWSSISMAEIRIKAMLGKLVVPDDLQSRIERAGIRPASFSIAAADELARWPTLVRHDPFDRMLLAQAVASGSRLVTADAVLLALDGAPVIDARI